MADRDASRVRVLAAEDHFGLRMGLAAALHGEADLLVVGEASNGLEAIEKYRELRPDLVLMDLRLAGEGSIPAIQRIRSEFPEARIVAWTASEQDGELAGALQAGACGYLLQDSGREGLLRTIRKAARGPESR